MTWNTKIKLASKIDSLTQFRSMIYLAKKITNSIGIIFDPSDNFQVILIYVKYKTIKYIDYYYNHLGILYICNYYTIN